MLFSTKLDTLRLLRETAEAAGAAHPEDLGNKIMLLFEGANTIRLVSGDDQAAATAREVAESLINQALSS